MLSWVRSFCRARSQDCSPENYGLELTTDKDSRVHMMLNPPETLQRTEWGCVSAELSLVKECEMPNEREKLRLDRGGVGKVRMEAEKLTAAQGNIDR